MKKSYGRVILLLCLPLSLKAYQWPVEDVILMSTFGEGMEGNFSCGILLSGRSQEVVSVEEGKVIFIQDQEDLSGLPSGLGNFVVLEHERNLVSLYAQLESLNEKLLHGGTLRAGSILGQITDTQGTSQAELYLEFMDKEFNRMVNPLHLLPILNDSLSPVIEAVTVEMGERFFLAEEGGELSAGEGELYVTLHDPSRLHPFLRPTTPYRIALFINGEEFFYQTFEIIEAREGTLVLITQKGQRSFEDLYADKNRYRMGKYAFKPGETILEVIVSDFFGNETTKTYRLRVLTR